MRDRAYISKLTHGSTADGRGIRTVVFFGGCGLACSWCHNPECITGKPTLMYYKSKCIGCGRCTEVCPSVFGRSDGGLSVTGNACDACGRCTAECLGEALTLSMRELTLDEVFSEICDDKPFYRHSCGGVTFSGGECLLQHEFVAELLKKCRTEGINTCIETCLDVPWEIIDGILGYVDSFFVDIKHMDEDTHRKYTGVSNERILSNLRRLYGVHSDITLRIPLIPGVNDSTDNLSRTAQFAASLGGTRKKFIELLKYNNLAKSKYESLGEVFTSYGTPQSTAEMFRLCERLNRLYDNVTFFCR